MWTLVHRCEQSFIAQRSQVQTANANRKQRRKLRQNQQQVITAAVSFGKQNPSTTSPQEVWRVLVSLHHAVKMQRENHMWTIVNRCEQSFIAQRSQVQTAIANRKQRRKLRQNQQKVITAAVSFGKQNPSTTSPQEVWRVLVSLHHAVKMQRENHMWTIVNRCEQMWTVIYRTKITSANGKCKQKTTEKTTTESTTSDHSSSQLLVSRIQVQLRHNKSEGSLFLCIMLSKWRGRITCEQLWTDVNSHLLHKDHKCKRQMQTENNGENYDRMDNKWSQQQSALVSRIKYNFATTSLKGPCFSASCCQIFEGELHVNACAQMWTVIYCTKITSANGKCKQENNGENYDRMDNKWSQQQSALVSRIQVQLRHNKSEGSLFLCIMLPDFRGRITCERLCTDVNSHLLHKDHKCKRQMQTENNGEKLRQNGQQVITAAVSFGKQNPSTTSPQQVWRVLVSLHHAVKMQRENHMWTLVHRCEQSFIAQRSQVQTANANRKQRRKLRQNQQQVITAAVSFGKQNPSTTSPQQVWRVLVSLHHAVKMERENHMWTLVHRCEQSFIAQRSQVQTANANRKQRRKFQIWNWIPMFWMYIVIETRHLYHHWTLQCSQANVTTSLKDSQPQTNASNVIILFSAMHFRLVICIITGHCSAHKQM